MRWPEPRRFWTLHPLWSVLALSVALRVAAAAYLGNVITPQPGIFDELSYHTLATRVLEGHGFSFATGWWPATQPNEPTAHWSYLYVLLLTGTYWLAGLNPLVARLVQAVACGVLQPLLTYAIGRRLFGHRAGLAAATVVASYAYFIYYAGALVTESLYIVAILWAIHLGLELADRGPVAEPRSWRNGWLPLGLALAVAVLLRQVMLPLVPLVLGWAGWRVAARPSQHRGRVLWGMSAAAAIVLLSMAPWTARNYHAFGQFVPLNTNAGFALFWGNHPNHGTSFVPILPGSEYGTLIPTEFRGLNEAELDKALLRRAVGFVLDEPGRFALLSVSRVKEYVKFWPSENSSTASNLSRVLSFGICLPFLLSGVLLAGRRSTDPSASEQRAGIWLLLGVAAAYSLIHVLTWTLVRYRLPVDAVLMPFAGLSLTRAWLHLSGWFAVPSPSPRVTEVSG